MRHILRYRAKGRPPDDDVERIRRAFGAKVVERDEQDRLWLVEATTAEAAALGPLPEWSVQPELPMSLPRDPAADE